MNIHERLTAALHGVESQLFEAYHAALTKQVDAMLAQLKADGGDAQKSFGYPMSSRLSRMEYLAQKARHDFCQKYTLYVGTGYRSHNDPEPRVECPNVRRMITDQARKDAKAALSAYIAKLDDKITRVIGCVLVHSLTYSGNENVWDWSHVTVDCGRGIKYTWRTKMILNFSCLGKPFNQWPTTLLK